MHCHCGTNNRVPRWTFTDPCKSEVRPGAREESASPAWLAAPAMNARNTMKVHIWRPDTGCGPTLYRKCHSHNTPGKENKEKSYEKKRKKTKRKKNENKIVRKETKQKKKKRKERKVKKRYEMKSRVRVRLRKPVGNTNEI